MYQSEMEKPVFEQHGGHTVCSTADGSEEEVKQSTHAGYGHDTLEHEYELSSP